MAASGQLTMSVWPVTLHEGRVGLRPIRLRDGSAWREVRSRNVAWLRPWEATVPTGSGDFPPSFSAMVRRLKAEAAETERTAAETERRLKAELAENERTATENDRRLRAEAAETERRLRAEVDKMDARYVLTSGVIGAQIVDFQTLIEYIDRSYLDVIPGEYLEGYSNSQQDANTSTTYLNANPSSVTDRERASNNLSISKMRRRMTEETPDKIRLNELTLNDEIMETMHVKVALLLVLRWMCRDER